MIWNNDRDEESKLGLQAYHTWHDWFKSQDNHASDIDSHNNQMMWNPPNEGWVKCSVDADFNKQKGTTNKDWCVRDCLGRFIIGGISLDVDLLSIIEVEALAIKEVVQAAIWLQLDYVIFENDSQTVVQTIHANYGGSSEFCLITTSLKSLLQYISNFEIKFIKHQVNSFAHLLIKTVNS